MDDYTYRIRCTFASRDYAIFDVTYYLSEQGKAINEWKIVREENVICKNGTEAITIATSCLGKDDNEIGMVVKEVEESVVEKANLIFE